jgi:aminopeptidase S
LGYTGTITVGQNTWNVQKLWSQSEGNCIVSKDFSIGYALTNGQIVRGGAGGSATITLAQLGGSTQAVSFSVSTLPTGVQVNWSSSSFNSGTTQLTVTATSSASRGSLSLTVVAQGSLYQKTLNVGGFTIV